MCRGRQRCQGSLIDSRYFDFNSTQKVVKLIVYLVDLDIEMQTRDVHPQTLKYISTGLNQSVNRKRSYNVLHQSVK